MSPARHRAVTFDHYDSAMLSAFLILACAAGPADGPASGAIVVKGSDSEVNVVQRLAEVFMEARHDARISVTGGGSGTGIAALIDGTADLANSSRAMSGLEKVAAKRAGRDVQAFVFATDGLAVVVNASNPVASMTMDQLGALFRGEIATWDTLGGTGPVSLYGRQSSSGTYDYFKKAAVKGEYSPTLKQMNGSAQIAEAIRADAGGVGYVAAGYVRGEAAERLRIVPLTRAIGEEPISPTDVAAVLSGAYPLARPLYQFTPRRPAGPLRDFLVFEGSPEGQRIVEEMGFFTVSEEARVANENVLEGAK